MDYQKIYQRLFEASRQAGIVARMLQPNIINEGKQVDYVEGEDGKHKAMREAKTKADEIVQEMLLHSLLPDYQNVLTLDVEEDTASILLFDQKDYAFTLVLDPIDGTLDYLEQKDTYSICSAILHNHDVKVAIVYFPKRDILYGYYEGQGAMMYHNITNKHWNEKESLLAGKEKNSKRIYKNARVAKDIVEALVKKGFDVKDDCEIHCPDAILQCMQKEALAYFADSRNIRDILLGAILSKMENGHIYSFSGDETSWESHGRQKEIVFTLYDKEKIF